LSVSRIPIRFVVEGVGKAEGELVRIRSPRTVDAIARRLPVGLLADGTCFLHFLGWNTALQSRQHYW